MLVDTGHHYQAQNIEQIVAWLLDEDMLGGFHFNDRRYADDDLTLGSHRSLPGLPHLPRDPFFACGDAARRADIAYMIDQSHNLKPKIEAMIQTVTMAQELYAKAALVDHERLIAAQTATDLVKAESLLQDAFATDVRPAIQRLARRPEACREIRWMRSGRAAISTASPPSARAETLPACLRTREARGLLHQPLRGPARSRLRRSCWSGTNQTFPSRQYTHRYVTPAGVEMDPPTLEAGGLYRFVLGRDSVPLDLRGGAATMPGDPFARLILLDAAAPPPVTIRTLLERLDALNTDPRGLPVQDVFVVADGGQIPWSPETDALQRNFRFVIVRRGTAAPEPDLFVSASTDLDSPSAFLQVIGWDPAAGAFQFYERRDGAWVWAGSSWDALTPDARGKGPFDSHVNGALNMKELKAPWIHWHSQAAAIADTVLAPADPLRAEKIWTGRAQAENLETLVRAGVRRWTEARLDWLTAGGTVTDLPAAFRQVVDTSTVNLASSSVSRNALERAVEITLPITFFFNADALAGTLELEPAVKRPAVPASVYREMLESFDVDITDGQLSFRGDTHFVFVVPEPAFEDVLILAMLLERRVLSRKLAAAMLMVDFENAVFSPRRAALLRYVPETGAAGNPAAFDGAFVTAVGNAPDAGTPGTPEHELLANWKLADTTWESEYARRIEAFMASVTTRCATAAGFTPVFQLAESRRREFRKRKLAEFRLTTPRTNIPEDAPLLEFAPDGAVRHK